MSANNIKILRVENGLSQKDLAKKVHLSQAAISQWEKGRTRPDVETANILADLFEVTVDYLLGRTKERTISYHASNIHSSFIQGNGTMMINDSKLSKEEAEILRIYRQSDVRARAKLLNAALELDSENAEQEGEQT